MFCNVYLQVQAPRAIQMSNAVTTLAQGSPGNEQWGPALGTLVGATSDVIKSIGMERHISFGLNIKSDVLHAPSERLNRINNCWGKISQSIKSQKFDFVLAYSDENDVRVEEAITKYSAGLILAVINSKDGTKAEKSAEKLQKKAQKKRKRDGDQYGGGREMGSRKSSRRQ